MNIGLIGSDFKKSAFKSLESVYLVKEEIPAFLARVCDGTLVKGMVALTTCNRVELYFSSDSVSQAAQTIMLALAKHLGVPFCEIEAVLRLYSEDAVLPHLFDVVSGLESMVLGENEILSQVKDAYAVSSDLGYTDTALNKVFQTAISIGKRVRTDTNISKGAYSVTSIAIDAIRESVRNYLDKPILIVGAGVMGRRALKKLTSLGHRKIKMLNRSSEKLVAITKLFSDIEVGLLSDFRTCLNEFPIIIMATSSDSYMISPELIDTKTGNIEMIVDLGLPRNVSPLVSQQVPQVVSMETLQDIVNANLGQRRLETDLIRSIIREEFQRLTEWSRYKQEKVNA